MKDILSWVWIVLVLFLMMYATLDMFVKMLTRSDQEKLCYFNHWTWASYEAGECRVITIYK